MKWEKLINWEHGFHINLRQTTYSKELAYVIFCCQNPIDTGFFNRLLLGMKSGFYRSTTHASASGSILKICQNRNQKTTCIRKKLCCQFGGISKVLSTMNFYVLIPQSTLSFTANNFKIWRLHYKQIVQKEEKFHCSMIMQNHIHQKLRAKSWKNSGGRFYLTHPIHQIWHLLIIICSAHYAIIWSKNSSMIKHN